jgi:glycosyltransferase involved in cell wall biosynthesis/2-polyprenyl-3-methyl-5-hydroxy-6-metoxy-1,4-benzoquinol methylase
MRVSLFNSNLLAKDAVGTSVINMARFFRRRGDQVQIFIEHPPEDVPKDTATLCRVLHLGDLIGGQQTHFELSDLFIYHYPAHYALLESIKGIERGAVIFDYHGVTPPELWGSAYDWDLLVRGVEGVSLVHYADLAIVHSEFTKAELIRHSGYETDRIRVLPLAVPLERFKPTGKDAGLVRKYGLEGQRVLLFVGRMAGNKRIDLLVRALAEIGEEIPDVKLLLVGDDRSSPAFVAIVEEAKAQAKELGVGEDVIFTGRVAELPKYYNLCDVYVTSSLHEGFGVPIIEAMACGVPVVGSHYGALPETIGEAGLTFEPGNVEDLADKVLSMLRDEELREKLVSKGLERVKGYSLDKYEERLERIVEEATQYVQSIPRAQAIPLIPEPLAEESRHIDDLKALEREADVAFRAYVIRSDKHLVGPFIEWVRRNMTSHLKEPYLDRIVERQVVFNAHLVRYLRYLANKLEDLETDLGLLESRLSLLETKQVSLKGMYRELERQMAGLQMLVGEAPEEFKRRADELRGLLKEIPAGLWPRIDRLWDLLVNAGQEDYGFSYYACSERVGGAVDMERALYAPFVELFADCQDVLDLGCGKGVFLSLLEERGITSRGVDLDEDMVAACRDAGLEVIQMEALAYLESIEDDSVGGIFSSHLIEHLPKPKIVRFLELCHAKLRPNAPVVIITPNAAGLTILHTTFYKDLTHRQPLHPEILKFLLEATGLRKVQVEFLSPMPEGQRLHLLDLDKVADEGQRALFEALNHNFRKLNDLLFGNVDCAVTAVK